MDKTWILLTAALIFVLFIFIYWRLTHGYAKKKYGMKVWKHWPMRLSYWQSAVLYSVGFTFLTMFLLKWSDILTF